MHTKQRLELLTDKNMHLMVEKGLRGGISQITQDVKNDESKIYLDANNLYGFEWLTEDEISNFG